MLNKILYLYKICSIKDYRMFMLQGIFKGNKKDLEDKFIHLSKADQVKETLKVHFFAKKNLCLIKIRVKNLNIKWEKSRDNLLFPHLYGSFDKKNIVKVYYLILNKKGIHILPILD